MMKLVKILTAVIVLLATVSVAFAESGFHMSWSGPGYFGSGGYQNIYVTDRSAGRFSTYGVASTPSSVNIGMTQCRNGRCGGATYGARNEGDGWYTSTATVRSPAGINANIYKNTQGSYSGNIRAGNDYYVPSYTRHSYYYPPTLANSGIYGYPDYYGSS